MLHDRLQRADPRHALHPANGRRSRSHRRPAGRRGGLDRSGRSHFRGSGQIRGGRAGAAEPAGRQAGMCLQGRRGDDARRGQGGVFRLLRTGLARHAGRGALRRPGPAEPRFDARAGNVDGGEPGLLAVPDADHRRHGRHRPSRLRRAEGAVYSENGGGDVDRHDEPDRAAGGLRPRRGAHARGSRRRRLSHHRHEDLHHLGRERRFRKHRPSRAGAAARRACGRKRHFAVHRAEIPGQCRWLARRAQRSRLLVDRAQARHPRQPDGGDVLRRQGRGDRAILSASRTAASNTCSP